MAGALYAFWDNMSITSEDTHVIGTVPAIYTAIHTAKPNRLLGWRCRLRRSCRLPGTCGSRCSVLCCAGTGLCRIGTAVLLFVLAQTHELGPFCMVPGREPGHGARRRPPPDRALEIPVWGYRCSRCWYSAGPAAGSYRMPQTADARGPDGTGHTSPPQNSPARHGGRSVSDY